MFSSRNKILPPEYHGILVNNDFISFTPHAKFLGILIDEHLTWEPHIDYISSKISRGVGILNKLRYCLPTNVLLSIYNAIVLPYLTYCNIVWGNNYPSRLQKLITIQKRAIRFISHSNNNSSSSPIFFSLNTLKVSDINKLQIASFVYQYNSGLLPNCFDNLFTARNTIHSYGTRHNNQFNLPLKRLTSSHFCICFWGQKFGIL